MLDKSKLGLIVISSGAKALRKIFEIGPSGTLPLAQPMRPPPITTCGSRKLRFSIYITQDSSSYYGSESQHFMQVYKTCALPS